MILAQSQHRLCGVSRTECCCHKDAGMWPRYFCYAKERGRRRQTELQSQVYLSYGNGKVKMATDVWGGIFFFPIGTR